MMTKAIRFKGKTYQIGDDPRHVPMPLPAWLPTVLPAGWTEIHTGAWTGGVRDRDYARAYQKHATLLVLVSCATQTDGHPWLHVSVSRKNREIPTWTVMSEVKDLFIGEARTAIQVHPPRVKHISIHPGVLHLWACLDAEVLPDFSAGGDTI
jgi:hypothetical protein